jgi:hypothetical protein
MSAQWSAVSFSDKKEGCGDDAYVYAVEQTS